MTKTKTKTILITGASSGFGLDTAETLQAAGHTVFAGVRDIAGRNRAVADRLRAKGIAPVELDVTDDASVDAAVAQVLAHSGGALDVVINNAGAAIMGVSEGFTTAQVRDLFEVNVFGVQRMLRATLPTLRARRDALVVTIGSVVGRVTFPFFGPYGASKFALEALTDSYRYELSQLGVDIVLIQPGAYPTNIFAVMQQPGDASRAEGYGEIAAIPAKMGESFAAAFAGADAPNPHEVAEAILKVVSAPQGARPERVVVGSGYGAAEINAAVAPIQRAALDGMGLSFLAQPAHAAAAE